MQAKSLLYARRAKGDLDLGLEPARIRTVRNGVNLRQPARMNTPGGLLPGGTEQEINVESILPNYRIGTRRVIEDRLFHYCLAGSAIAIPQRGVANASPHLEGACPAGHNAVKGAYTLDLPEACADFPALIYNTEDIYAGGWLWIMGAAGDPGYHEFHRILGNDAAGTLGYVRVYLETPIMTDQDTPWITAYRNIYANCQQDYPNVPTNKQAIVCMTACGLAVTSGRYFWGQTWGPSWTTAWSATPGLLDGDRELIFRGGGIIAIKREFDPTSHSCQRAGYILSNTENTGDMMFMLQLAP